MKMEKMYNKINKIVTKHSEELAFGLAEILKNIPEDAKEDKRIKEIVGSIDEQSGIFSALGTFIDERPGGIIPRQYTEDGSLSLSYTRNTRVFVYGQNGELPFSFSIEVKPYDFSVLDFLNKSEEQQNKELKAEIEARVGQTI